MNAPGTDLSQNQTDQNAAPESTFHTLTPEAYASYGSMEGIYDPIVEITYLGSLSPEAYASYGSMEGVAMPAGDIAPPRVKVIEKPPSTVPGYLVATGAATLAFLIHRLPFAPFAVASETGIRHPISAAIIAIVAGTMMRNLLPLPTTITAGCKAIVKKMIPVAIVLTGAGLNLTVLATIGFTALMITVTCLTLAVAAGYYLGRMFGLNTRTALLIGAGTGICGNSAIVAVAPLLEADDEELVLSIGTINLFGLLVMLACPLLGGMLNLSDESFGVWSGTSIHAVPQVVAAGFAYSHEAGTLATLVKLVRVTLLAPLVFVLALIYASRHTADAEPKKRSVVVHYARLVPWFVWGFIAFALLNTLGLIPALSFEPAQLVADHTEEVRLPLTNIFTQTAKILLTVAMAAIGLELNVRHLAVVGVRALATGFAASVILMTASLVLIKLFM